MRKPATVGRWIVPGLTVAARAAVWFLGALTLLALLEPISSYLELLTFLRVQYAALLLLAAGIALAVRRPRLALAAFLLVLVNVAVVAPTLGSPQDETATRAGSLNLLLVNLESGNDRHADVANLIAEVKPDVVGLVELTPTWTAALVPALSGFTFRQVEAEPGAYGIGLYSRQPLQGVTVEHFPPEGPASIVARVELAGEPLTLVVTHAHTPFAGDIHRRQFEALADARSSLGARLAICGDFNAVPWSSSFRHLASAADLSDVHRGHWLEGSWPTGSLLVRVPIDNCLISHGVTVLEQEHGPDVGSDHLPLIIRFGLSATPSP